MLTSMIRSVCLVSPWRWGIRRENLLNMKQKDAMDNDFVIDLLKSTEFNPANYWLTCNSPGQIQWLDPRITSRIPRYLPKTLLHTVPSIHPICPTTPTPNPKAVCLPTPPAIRRDGEKPHTTMEIRFIRGWEWDIVEDHEEDEDCGYEDENDWDDVCDRGSLFAGFLGHDLFQCWLHVIKIG